MVSPTEIILEYVCPSLGVLAANLMFVAPLKDLRSAVTLGAGLGDLNPTPWAFMLGNCLGWTSYGILLSNWFVFWANYPGFLIACWLNLGAVKLMYSSHHQDEARRSLVEYLSSHRREDVDPAQRRSLLQHDQTNPRRQHENDENENNDDRCGNHVTNENDNRDSTNIAEIGESPTSTNNTLPSSISAQDRDDSNANAQQPHDWAKIVWDVTSQTTPAKAPHDFLVVGIVIVWSAVLSAIGFYKYYSSLSNEEDPIDAGNSESPSSSTNADDVAQAIVGYVVNFNLVFFYGAPLSAINRVLQTKRADALHVPTMVMNTSNAVFWTAYALAPQINDPFIYVPNALGVVLGAMQFFLWMVFPKTTTIHEQSGRSSTASGGGKGNHNQTNNNHENNEHVPGAEENPLQC